ncbi:EF-hand domain-containing protein [Planctomycetaceae bacterium SH139]
MMIRQIATLSILLTVTLASDVTAQRRGGGDRGDSGRGGERGDGERGGDSERGGRGSFRGGFGGGPPGGFGGGPPGGFGGGRPSFGGGGGPSSFLDRMDRNGNGSLDPDEMQGPMRSMIERLGREDSSINPDRPIPMSKIKEAFEKMRGGRGGGGGDDEDEEEDSLSAGILVPGFGGVDLPPPVPGFGATADLMAVRVTPEDTRQAEELLRRYDRNRNNFIDASETSSRWQGNPMDFDQNRDNRLSVSELAVRYARRRLDSEDSGRREDSRRRERSEEEPDLTVEDRFEGRKSYRPLPFSLPDGVPGWFEDKDSDKDGQVRMSEFASEWTDELVEEFYGHDRNFDGVITANEALISVKDGPARRVDTAASSRTAEVKPVATEDLEPRYVKTAERIVSRNDKDNSGSLTVDEWKDMIMDISGADLNRDGKITKEEYAGWMQARDKARN